MYTQRHTYQHINTYTNTGFSVTAPSLSYKRLVIVLQQWQCKCLSVTVPILFKGAASLIHHWLWGTISWMLTTISYLEKKKPKNNLTPQGESAEAILPVSGYPGTSSCPVYLLFCLLETPLVQSRTLSPVFVIVQPNQSDIMISSSWITVRWYLVHSWHTGWWSLHF